MLDFNKIDMRVSRTEQKKAHERLQSLSVPLALLTPAQWQKLPVSPYFLDELQQLTQISAAAAKNRQIKRIGNLIAEEDRHQLVEALFTLTFTPPQITKIQTWQKRLNIHDDSTLKQFVKQYYASEYNTLYQLLLWIEYAKHQQDDELLAESTQDLYSYIKEVAILSHHKNTAK